MGYIYQELLALIFRSGHRLFALVTKYDKQL